MTQNSSPNHKCLTMHLVGPDHAPTLFDLVEKNRAYLRKWLPWLDNTLNVTDTQNFINKVSKQYKGGGGPHFLLFFDDSPCGIIGFHRLDKFKRQAAIGYWIAQSYTGYGIITAATAKMVELGFSQYKLDQIEIRCATKNHASRKIPERLGFTYEGNQNQAEWLYDTYVDHAVYSIRPNEIHIQSHYLAVTVISS